MTVMQLYARSPMDQAARQRAYEDELIHRYSNNLSMSISERATVRAILKARSPAHGAALDDDCDHANMNWCGTRCLSCGVLVRS